jgi:hypothetical protein
VIECACLEPENRAGRMNNSAPHVVQNVPGLLRHSIWQEGQKPSIGLDAFDVNDCWVEVAKSMVKGCFGG